MNPLHLLASVWSALLVAAVLTVPGSLVLIALRHNVFPPTTAGAASLSRDEKILLAAIFVPTVSFLIMILLGLLLNAAAFSLGMASWTVGLCGVFDALVIVLVVRGDLPPRRAVRLPWTSWVRSPRASVYLLCGLALVLLAASYAVDVWGAENLGQVSVTELWASPGRSPGTVAVGIRNGEGRDEVCVLRFTWPGLTKPSALGPIRLGPGRIWHADISVPARERDRVDIALTALVGHLTRHRSVWITLPSHRSRT